MVRRLLIFLIIFSSIGIFILSAQKNEESRHYQDIAILCEQIKNNPNNINALYERGISYVRVGEYEKAMDDAEKGLSLMADQHKFHYLKSLIHFKRKHYEQAIEEIDLALKEKNEDLEYLFFKGLLESYSGDFREAILSIDKMLALDSRLDYCYLQKAIWCEKMNMYYESIKNYLYYIKISADQTNVKMSQKRLKVLIKSDDYFRDLYRNAKKEIRKKGYPWEK